jgi:hypothetical protein
MDLEKLISSFTEYEKKKILEIIIFSDVVKDTKLPESTNKDTLTDFLKNEDVKLSVNLRKVLNRVCMFHINHNMYTELVSKNIHDIKKEELLQFRRFGPHCWMEFEQAVSKYKPKPFIVKQKILLDDWLKDFQKQGKRAGQISIRLYNLLFAINKAYVQYDDGIYIDQIEEQECYRYRNFGKKSWEEFVKLRGY